MFSGVVTFLVTYQWLSIICFVLLWYIYSFYSNNIWKKLGVYYLTPLPFFGNFFELVVGTTTLHDSQIVMYNRIGNRRFAGLYRMTSPVLFIKDPELIETIMIKDFHHFTDRGIPLDEKREPLNAHLFSLSGKKWKNLRNKLSPVFTSGKLKMMHQQLIDCADVLHDVFVANSNTGQTVDFKETMAQFTTDVIGSCAYGLNMNSLKDPNSEFRVMGRKVFEVSMAKKLKGFLFILLLSVWPKLAFKIGVQSLPRDVNDFFLNLVPKTIKAREKNPQFKRNDFIQLLMNLRQQDDSKTQLDGPEKEQELVETDDVYLDDNILAANAFLFFIAGFETTASTLTYCLFELAQHPDIQEKLYQEVNDVLSKHEGQPTYDAIKNLHYMDMVISETLRKYPPAPLLFRICTEDYLISGTDIVFPKGQSIEIPIYALHRDPDIFAEPEDFMPERFSPENKDSIPKGAYLPFGDGPRICIVHLDDNMLAANAFLFFIAGFETTASTLTYCLFELAQHPDIQEKLYQEVNDVLSKHDGQPTYDAIKNLHYMDMVISETLRKYPPVPMLLRICTEDYLIPGTDIVLPKGQRVEIPTYALHHDPNIYAEPQDFVPERFSPENKDSIPKGAYLPFGDGPRICIAARFAQMEMKVCLSKVLSKFRIVKSADMTDAIEFDPKSPFLLLPKRGVHMNIAEREKH